MLEENVSIMTRLAAVNTALAPVYLRFKSEGRDCFEVDRVITRVLTTVPVSSIMCMTLVELGFVPIDINAENTTWYRSQCV